MVSISQYTRICKNGIQIITGMEKIPCPVCGGALFVRGTCGRLLRTVDGSQIKLRLRVLECEGCGKTHRELPDKVIPYKRHDIESVCTMVERPDECIPEPSVRLRVLAWLAWFLSYAKHIMDSLRQQGLRLAEQPGNSIRRQLTYFVRLTVNSGNWIQHRSVMTLG